jgi:hypothetical protein
MAFFGRARLRRAQSRRAASPIISGRRGARQLERRREALLAVAAARLPSCEVEAGHLQEDRLIRFLKTFHAAFGKSRGLDYSPSAATALRGTRQFSRRRLRGECGHAPAFGGLADRGRSARGGRYKLLEKVGEGRLRRGLCGRADGAGAAARGLKVIKLGMDTKAGGRPFRSRAPGLGHDGPSQHRQGARRRRHRNRPPFFVMELVRASRSLTILRPEQPFHQGTARLVHQSLPGHSARAPKGHHPPRHQAVEHPGDAARRRAGAQGD